MARIFGFTLLAINLPAFVGGVFLLAAAVTGKAEGMAKVALLVVPGVLLYALLAIRLWFGKMIVHDAVVLVGFVILNVVWLVFFARLNFGNLDNGIGDYYLVGLPFASIAMAAAALVSSMVARGGVQGSGVDG